MARKEESHYGVSILKKLVTECLRTKKLAIFEAKDIFVKFSKYGTLSIHLLGLETHSRQKSNALGKA